MEPLSSVEERFDREYARRVRALAVAFDPEAASET
jgi:hypothetical protein